MTKPKLASKKRPVKKPAKKPVKKKKVAANKVTKRRPVVPAVSPVVTAPLVVAVPEKPLAEQPQNRAKLWLAVSLSMAIIVCLWAYSLSQTVLSSNAIEDSLANSSVDEFVSSLSDSFQNLKTDSANFMATNQTEVVAPEELDNLFSDIE